MTFQHAHVAQTFRMYMILTIFIVMSTITIWWTVREFQALHQEMETIRTQHLVSQQTLLQNVVNDAVAYIQYQHRLTEERLRQTIRDRVNEAHEIAWNLYRQYQGKEEEARIQAMIKEALRPIRFNHGRGYYFAINLNGVEELFADRPELEGKDLSGMQDTQGQFVIQDMIALVQQSGEGFYQYTWTKPNAQGEHFPKIAFVKRFEPYDWVIGTGEYIDDVLADIQQETLQRLVTVRFGSEGYLFGSTYHADPLFTNGKITVGGGSLLDLSDPNGVKITQEQLKAIQKREGGFVRYSWKKLNSSSTPFPKIAFVKGVPEWEWVIGAGVYLDEVEAVIAQKKAELAKQITRDILSMVFVFAALLAGSFAIAHFLGKQLAKSFQTFTTFFETAATNFTPIADAPLHFAEFERLAASANQMIAARKQAEVALLEKHNQLQMLIDSTPDHIYAKDALHRFLIGNQRTLHDLGLRSPSELLGKTDRDFHDPERARRFEEEERMVMTSGQMLLNREDSIISFATGEQRWLLTTKAPLRDTQGNIVGLVGYNRDITDRKQAQEELATAKTLLEKTFEQSPVSLVLVSMPDAIIRIVNPACREFLGIQDETSPMGMPLLNFIPSYQDYDRRGHPGAVADLPLARALQGQKTNNEERMIVRKDGTARWGLVSGTPIYNAQGDLIAGYLIMTDITERKLAEQASRESEERLRTLINAMPDIVCFKDGEGRWLEANTFDLQLFQIEGVDYRGKKDSELAAFSEFYREAFLTCEATDEHAWQAGGISRGEETIPRPNQSPAVFDIIKVATFHPDGRRKGLVVVGRDITERKHAEEDVRRLNIELEARVQKRTEQLEATNKELESFAYIVSHDLKAPLRNITQLITWLVDDYSASFDEQGKEYADLLVGRVRRMENLINGVLEYSRIGRIVHTDEPLDINLLLLEVLDTLAPPPQITITLADTFPTIIGDKTRISQIFQNLLGNAMKFMDKPEGKIFIDCQERETVWQFSVTDNGQGIDAQHYERIFQIFQTLHSRDEIESTGIGLAIVKKIIEFYGGSIWVESDVGKGSTFCFTLPKPEGNFGLDNQKIISNKNEVTD